MGRERRGGREREWGGGEGERGRWKVEGGERERVRGRERESGRESETDRQTEKEREYCKMYNTKQKE